MALAYPEGECFFQRSVLDSSVYHANDVKDFYSHLMVEFVWNKEADHGAGECMTAESRKGRGHRHPRSGYKIVRGSWWDTDYGNWTQLPFSYGTHWKKITRRVEHNLCVNGNQFRDREKGGAYRPFFMMMPMPTREERWCLAPIRAIYLPVAHSVSKDHSDLCSFVQVNFALSRTVKFWHGEGWFRDVTTDKVLGLKQDVQRTLALDVAGLVSLLTLPRQLRRDNCYNLKLIKLQQSISLQPDPGVSKSYSDGPDISWLTVAKGNYGLDLTWQPPQKSTWQESFIKNTLTVATGFIPGVGPIVQIMFSVGWTLISQEDPQAAFAVLKELAPGFDLGEKIITEIKKAAKETRAFLPDGWEELNLKTQQEVVKVEMASRPVEAMDAMLPMILQKEVLDATGNSPDKESSGGSQDEGETLVDVAAGDMVDAGKTVAGAVESAIPGM
ncbi:MAG: hypothetical protein Q9168_004137 [Polycauliona sp. 1 TL-2023]